MADMPTATDVDTEDDGKSRKSKLIVILIAVLLLGGAGYAAMTMFGGGDTEPVVVETEPAEGEIVPVGDMTTGLAGDDPKYVRLSMSLVLSEQATAGDVEARIPLLRDRALDVLMSTDSATLQTADGADTLRAELTDAAQQVYEDEQVLRVVLTDLLVQ